MDQSDAAGRIILMVYWAAGRTGLPRPTKRTNQTQEAQLCRLQRVLRPSSTCTGRTNRMRGEGIYPQSGPIVDQSDRRTRPDEIRSSPLIDKFPLDPALMQGSVFTGNRR
eukprot:1188352-Prorocentrum_minimum.AAC.1